MTHLTRIIILVVGLAVIGSANSQISKTITYQGVLTDASDARITGTVALDLNIYAASGGGSLYADSHASVDVANGLFTVVIGTGTGGAIALPLATKGKRPTRMSRPCSLAFASVSPTLATCGLQ